MKEQAMSDIESRVRRLERQNRHQSRALVILLCAALVLGSIAVSNAQPTVLTAQEVRAQRFTLVDPNGGIAADWYIAASPADRDNMTQNLVAPYSRWPYHRP
jgi:hypothetical protein